MNQPAFSRLVLLGPATAARDANVRRYRLARLQLNGRATGRNRFEHLRRTYD